MESHATGTRRSASAALLLRTAQALQMVKLLSDTYVSATIEFDTRLFLREAARKLNDDNVHNGDVEYYFNIERPAALPAEALEIFRNQSAWEIENDKITTPPGFSILLAHLRLTTMPAEFTHLHTSVGHQLFRDWEPIHRLIYEIISIHRDGDGIRELTELTDVTPLHFQVIPFSTAYRLGRRDPLTTFWGAIRREITDALSSIHNAPGLNSPRKPYCYLRNLGHV